MKTKNLGKIVAKAMKKKGVKKVYLAKLIKVTRPTLDTRLVDGEFDEAQIKILKAEGFIPPPKKKKK